MVSKSNLLTNLPISKSENLKMITKSVCSHFWYNFEKTFIKTYNKVTIQDSLLFSWSNVKFQVQNYKLIISYFLTPRENHKNWYFLVVKGLENTGMPQSSFTGWRNLSYCKILTKITAKMKNLELRIKHNCM